MPVYNPSFGGVAIFGFTVTMATSDNPRAAQNNAYPGLNGVESLDQGLRGRFTTVSGKLVGNDIFDLGNSEETFRSFNDGYARTLIDTRGITWPNVKLESFEPQGRVRTIANTGQAFRDYTARFHHLS